jgi:hypothetical protein
MENNVIPHTKELEKIKACIEPSHHQKDYLND